MKVTDELVNRFLSWPLPDSVCSDECVTKRDWGKAQGWPKRVGTNLLTADEARQMLEYVLAPESPAKNDTICKSCRGSGTVKGMTYGHGPDDYETDVTCPDCNGTGESPAKEQPGGQTDMRQFLEYWTADGHLQTFEDRERFRKAAIALIEKLGQGWIPVSERLPHKSDGFVVVRDADGQLGFASMEKGKLVELSEGGMLYPSHWLTLPPPPERP